MQNVSTAATAAPNIDTGGYKPRYCAGHYTDLKIDWWMTPLLSDFLVLYILILFFSLLNTFPKRKAKKGVGKKTNTTQAILLFVNRVDKKKTVNDFSKKI